MLNLKNVNINLLSPEVANIFCKPPVVNISKTSFVLERVGFFSFNPEQSSHHGHDGLLLIKHGSISAPSLTIPPT